MTLLRQFSRNATGTIAVSFALSLVGLVIAVGCGVDYVRWHKAQTELQSIADAAALSAGASNETTAKKLQKIAASFVDGNSAEITSQNVETTVFDYNPESQTVSLTLEGDIPTSLMGLAGITEMATVASSTVKLRGTPPVEAVLVLDTTYSMVGSKINSLKDAAKSLVKTILKNPQARVGIVPFGSYVNVGVSRRDEPGFDVPNDYSTKSQSCSTTYPNAKNCKKKTTTSTCKSTKDGVTTTYSCTSTTTTCDSWGDPVKTCKTVTTKNKFNGCVGSRAEKYRPVVSSITNEYPGMMNTTCANEILDLTDKVGPAVSAIEALSVAGETYLPGGITWGWNMLTPDAPLNSALSTAALQAKGGKKALIIMTDGSNTLAPTSVDASGHGPMTSGPYKSKPYANNLTTELCKNIKADNIDVYTVLYDVEDAAVETILRDCASASSKSFVAKSSSELIAAFDSIARQLAMVRIVK
ncbi:MAG: VWA domain-containing protein [Rhizobiales bacterium]|nr:VWA domain-containing protein [Hyphomicrobiales bacterium]